MTQTAAFELHLSVVLLHVTRIDVSWETPARAPRPGGGHHPDFHISSYRVVTVVMSTHSVGALTATGTTLACTGLTVLAPGSPLLCRPVRAGGLAVATQLGPPPLPNCR